MILLTPILALAINVSALSPVVPMPEVIPPEPVVVATDSQEPSGEPTRRDVVNSKEYTDEWSTAV